MGGERAQGCRQIQCLPVSAPGTRGCLWEKMVALCPGHVSGGDTCAFFLTPSPMRRNLVIKNPELDRQLLGFLAV